MIRFVVVVAALALVIAAAPASADSCSFMILKDDLPDCVKDLDRKISLLQVELQTERSRNRLNESLTCNLALALNASSPSADNASIVEMACAEAKERFEAAKKRGRQKAKTARP